MSQIALSPLRWLIDDALEEREGHHALDTTLLSILLSSTGDHADGCYESYETRVFNEGILRH